MVDSAKCLSIVGSFHGDFLGLYQFGAACTGDHQKFHFDYNDASTP